VSNKRKQPDEIQVRYWNSLRSWSWSGQVNHKISWSPTIYLKRLMLESSNFVYG